MKNCDLTTGASRIRLALEDLRDAWIVAAESWDDATSRAFAENHLEPLIPVVKNSLDAIGRMDTLLKQAQRDCES